VARPYAFIKFDKNIKKKGKEYANPSSRSNTSRLNDDLSDIHSIMKKNINEVRFYFCCLPTHACEVCRVRVFRVAVRARAAAVDACLVVCVSVPVSSSCLDLSVFERY